MNSRSLVSFMVRRMLTQFLDQALHLLSSFLAHHVFLKNDCYAFKDSLARLFKWVQKCALLDSTGCKYHLCGPDEIDKFARIRFVEVYCLLEIRLETEILSACVYSLDPFTCRFNGTV